MALIDFAPAAFVATTPRRYRGSRPAHKVPKTRRALPHDRRPDQLQRAFRRVASPRAVNKPGVGGRPAR